MTSKLTISVYGKDYDEELIKHYYEGDISEWLLVTKGQIFAIGNRQAIVVNTDADGFLFQFQDNLQPTFVRWENFKLEFI